MKDSKPTIYDPSFLPTNIYGGTPTFMNLPVIENRCPVDKTTKREEVKQLHRKHDELHPGHD